MVRKLIQDRLAELKITRKQLSVAIDCDPGYISQFLVRGVPVELHEPERIKIAEILKISPDALRGPSALLPKRNYVKSSETVSHSPRNAGMPDAVRNLIDLPVPAPSLFGAADLPVFGTAQGGQGGSLIMTNEAVDYVVRPAPLLRVKDGYGMIVSGDSMSPQFESGSTALVNPHLPPRNGDTCVFRNHQDDGTVFAVIKKLRRFNDETWFVSQFNPAKDFTLKRSDWQICHPTVGSYFP